MAIFIGTGGESRDLPLDVTAALGSMRAAPMECVRVCPNCHLYVNRTYSDSHRRTRASRELLAGSLREASVCERNPPQELRTSRVPAYA